MSVTSEINPTAAAVGYTHSPTVQKVPPTCVPLTVDATNTTRDDTLIVQSTRIYTITVCVPVGSCFA